jgi:hypothetical protein
MKRFILLITILIPLLSAAQKSDVRTPNNVRLDTIVWQDGSKTYTSSIAGLPVSNFLSWNSVGKYYEPYPTIALTLDSARFYKGIARPTGKKRITLNGFFNASNLFHDSINRNLIIGNNNLLPLTSANDNTVIGDGIIIDATTFNGNVLIGNLVSTIQTLKRSVVIGLEAGASSDSSVIIGYRAAGGMSGHRNVIIGFNAGNGPSFDSDKLIINNSNSSTPLIYGDFSTPLLKINGTLNVTANMETTTAGDGLILKSPNGTRYKLTVDNAGTLVITSL